MKFCRFLFAYSCVLFLFHSNAQAQIIHGGKGLVCFNDLTHFSYVPPAGKTAQSYQWKMGDNFTSQDPSPIHLYKSAGTFTVSLSVKLSDGSTASESMQVKVLALPKASFSIDHNSSRCQYDRLTIKDASRPGASDRPIAVRNILWGDGELNIDSNSINPIKSHTYRTADDFDIELEIIDSKGCKSLDIKRITIKDGIIADWRSKFDNKNCTDVEVCLNNASTVKQGVKASYTWNFDGLGSQSDHFSASLCKRYTQSKVAFVELIARTSEGCTRSKKEAINIDVEQRTYKVNATDSVVCYGQKSVSYYVAISKDESVEWIINDTLEAGQEQNLNVGFEKFNLDTGWHKIKCRIRRDKCIKDITKNLHIVGPRAKPTIFNGSQCGANRKVFFVSDLDANYRSDWEYKWVIQDPYGENCVIDRANNINKNKNCNTTIGWFGKHLFQEQEIYTASFTVTDKESGCSDSKLFTLNMNACGNCNAQFGQLEVCQGAWFMSPQRSDSDPIKFSFDKSKWFPYPSRLPDHYVGVQDLWLIYEYKAPAWAEDYGDDSIRIHQWPNKIVDTLFFKQGVLISPAKQDTVTTEFSTSCEPVTATVRLKNGEFKPGERITINWGDTAFDEFEYQFATVQKEFTHEYKSQGGAGEIIVTLYTEKDCPFTYRFPYKYGFTMNIVPVDSACVGREVCMKADIRDYATGLKWHPDGWDGVSSWYRDGKLLKDKDFNFCTTFDKIGVHTIKIQVKSARGCLDSMEYSYRVNSVQAGIKKQSTLHYCRGLRAFLDSSKSLSPHDPIAKYEWDFGSGKFSSLLKDPVFSFDGSKKIVKLRHAVTSQNGCTDTAYVSLRILKSSPALLSDDSVGCSAFTPTIKNESQGASHYIWEMGDPDNTTVQKTDNSSVSFTYTKPGRYEVKLIGVDSSYNPVSQKIYYCYTKFPNDTQAPVHIVVLPSSHKGITGPDTLCVNEVGLFKSSTEAEIDDERWLVDDDTFVRENGVTEKLQFAQAGEYQIHLLPNYKGHELVPRCIDSIHKKVIVEEVKADFLIDPNSVQPIFKFINQSEPIAAKFQWDFNDPASGADNYSNEVHTSHNYRKRTGNYRVCLTATTRPGCSDRVCKPLTNTYALYTEVFNVFTPGQNDGFNQQYEVFLDGESQHEFTVYNRWGEAVFSSKNSRPQDETIVWNGRVNNSGAECPEGTYFYVFTYAYAHEPDKEIKSSGTITLIRD